MTTTISVSIEELYQQYYGKVYQRCYWLTRNPQVAEDLAQETFLRALKAPIKDHPNIRSWLYTIATHMCIDYMRHAHLHCFISTDSDEATELPEMSNPFEDVGERELIDQAFARLRPAHREVLQRWLEDKTSVNQMPKDKQLAYHARQEFRQEYREVEQEVGA